MLDLKEKAAFERCVDVMARLVEKYGAQEDICNNDEVKEDIA